MLVLGENHLGGGILYGGACMACMEGEFWGRRILGRSRGRNRGATVFRRGLFAGRAAVKEAIIKFLKEEECAEGRGVQYRYFTELSDRVAAGSGGRGTEEDGETSPRILLVFPRDSHFGGFL